MHFLVLLCTQFSREALPLLANGQMKVPVDTVYPLEESGKAHTRMRESKNIGKIILKIS